jgi:hypothetical protein
MPLKALEVCVLLKGMAGDSKLEGISKLLAPLKFMRLKPGVLIIRDATVGEAPGYLQSFEPDNCESHFDRYPESRKKALYKIIEGTTPVEITADKYASLLRYCQSFERHFAFARDMTLVSKIYFIPPTVSSKLALELLHKLYTVSGLFLFQNLQCHLNNQIVNKFQALAELRRLLSAEKLLISGSGLAIGLGRAWVITGSSISNMATYTRSIIISILLKLGCKPLARKPRQTTAS